MDDCGEIVTCATVLTNCVAPILLDDSTLLIGNTAGEGEKVDSGGVGGLGGVEEKNNVEGKVMEGIENGKGCFDNENGGSSSDDSTNDVHFSDSEGERNLGLDDSFEETNVEDKGQNGRKLKTKTTPMKNLILTPKNRVEKLTPKRLRKQKERFFRGKIVECILWKLTLRFTTKC
ncbi:telomerase-binding protein EST1A [Sesbania bispinosa]|nr:telomerase-binding protein EST1A [Sesbania bispinosa]